MHCRPKSSNNSAMERYNHGKETVVGWNPWSACMVLYRFVNRYHSEDFWHWNLWNEWLYAYKLFSGFVQIIPYAYNVNETYTKRKRKRFDSVLWQKPLHQQKCQKGKVTTQTTPQKSSIKQRLRTDLGRSVGVTKATQLVWLTGLRAHLPTNRNSRLIKRTHV